MQATGTMRHTRWVRVASLLHIVGEVAPVCGCSASNGTAVSAGECSFPAAQSWELPAVGAPADTIRLSSPTLASPLCLDYDCTAQNPCFVKLAYGPAAVAAECSTRSPKFKVHNNGTITVASSSAAGAGAGDTTGWCLDLRNGKTVVQVYPCVGSQN